jgi:hypothetical protein
MYDFISFPTYHPKRFHLFTISSPYSPRYPFPPSHPLMSMNRVPKGGNKPQTPIGRVGGKKNLREEWRRGTKIDTKPMTALEYHLPPKKRKEIKRGKTCIKRPPWITDCGL